jgi:acetyl esterase/lipase
MKRLRLNLRLPLFLLLAGLPAGCAQRIPKNVQAGRNLEYGRASGEPLQLDIYRPKVITQKLPVVVWIYGGAWKAGNKDFCPIAFMATQQLAIVSINYRLDSVAPFPAQIYDCKGAIRWLRANADKYDLDATHIGVFGASAGGHLALLLATTAGNPKMEGNVGGNLNFSSRVQCVCAFYPPTDLNRLVSDPQVRADPHGDVATLIGGAVDQNIDKAIAASPLTYVNKNCAPVFLMHGGADTLVPPEQSEIFYQALLKAGVEARLEIVPGQGHGIIAPPNVAEEIYQFFEKYLGLSGAGQKTRHSEIARPNAIKGS